MQVAQTICRYITLTKLARQRIAKAEAEGLCVACLTPLDETRTIRGCHERCYRATTRAIKSGKTTEKERMQAGKLLSNAEPGKKPSNPVSLEFS